MHGCPAVVMTAGDFIVEGLVSAAIGSMRPPGLSLEMGIWRVLAQGPLRRLGPSEAAESVARLISI